jgi:hypothetical protein
MNIWELVNVDADPIGWLIASVGLLLSIFKGRRERASKKASYVVTALPIGPTTHEVSIRLTNSGSVPIVRDDYYRPFAFTFGESAEIEDARVLEEVPPDLGVGVRISSPPNTVELTPVLLNPRDSLLLRASAKGFQRVQPQGRISGLTQMEEVKVPTQGLAARGVWLRFLALAFLLVRWPRAFFAGLPRRGGLVVAFLFGLLCYETAIVLSLLSGSSGATEALSGQAAVAAPTPAFISTLETSGATGVLAGEVSYIVALALAPVIILLRAAIYHVFVRVFVGARNSGFTTTCRVFCYSLVGSLVAWIPYIGILGSIWVLYLLYVGIREMHTVRSDKAALAILVPTLSTLLIALLLSLLAPVDSTNGDGPSTPEQTTTMETTIEGTTAGSPTPDGTTAGSPTPDGTTTDGTTTDGTTTGGPTVY